MPDNKTSLEKYAEIQAMVQKEARDVATQVYKELGTRTGVAVVPLHIHNGVDTPKIPQSSIIPNLRALGSITMSTDGTRYSLGLTFTPTQVWFLGNAIHRTGGSIDIRAQVQGTAQIGPSYFFQPHSATAVTAGSNIHPVVQGSSYFLVDSSTSPVTVRTAASEDHLVSVNYPTSVDIAARATVPDNWGGNGELFVDVTLGTDWEINGTFIVM